ncbi:hypothetical protein [Bradyrhizobium arachidis]|uniref:Uncharacterized protein n=1 Tax=Bradyrhizobium arachidis TaxID=858423 RepID=A0AAE7TIH6_9BRAD|nr:hypothetical protein [Bradyrhizobium arachidis]QOZ69309.1 hypothetical protein WN72_25570 [Bradyrhizobium arachidis]SFV11808.1 hypothetical protein SAMN05192541_117148 [Bradyrhizobium arachidis]
MNSTLDDGLAKEPIASLEEQLSNLLEAGFAPTAPPASMKRSPAALATIQAHWQYVAFVGLLLAASMSVAAWWWSSSVETARMTASDPAALTRAVPDAVAPTAVALSSELTQQLQPMARDLAALSQTVEQLKARQEQLIRDNDNLASQLKASREELARNDRIIDQIKANQIEMARQNMTLTERLDANEEQLARVLTSASEPKATPEAPPQVSPEEPKVMPDIPLPRPRQPANVAQTQRPPPTPERSQAKKPQPLLAWPWSQR